MSHWIKAAVKNTHKHLLKHTELSVSRGDAENAHKHHRKCSIPSCLWKCSVASRCFTNRYIYICAVYSLSERWWSALVGSMTLGNHLFATSTEIRAGPRLAESSHVTREQPGATDASRRDQKSWRSINERRPHRQSRADRKTQSVCLDRTPVCKSQRHTTHTTDTQKTQQSTFSTHDQRNLCFWAKICFKKLHFKQWSSRKYTFES